MLRIRQNPFCEGAAFGSGLPFAELLQFGVHCAVLRLQLLHCGQQVLRVFQRLPKLLMKVAEPVVPLLRSRAGYSLDTPHAGGH